MRDAPHESLDPLNDQIAEVARKYLADRRMSLRQLAEKTNGAVSHSRASALFGGRQMWTAYYLRTVAEVLGITPVMLLPGAGPAQLGALVSDDVLRISRCIEADDAVGAMAALTDALRTRKAK